LTGDSTIGRYIKRVDEQAKIFINAKILGRNSKHIADTILLLVKTNLAIA
jgi:hypothetical protein